MDVTVESYRLLIKRAPGLMEKKTPVDAKLIIAVTEGRKGKGEERERERVSSEQPPDSYRKILPQSATPVREKKE